MKYFFFILSGLLSLQVAGQDFWVDFYGGAMNYQGETQQKRYDFGQAHFAWGAGITYDINEHFSGRLVFSMGKISGDDQFGINKSRNLSFATSIFETQIALKYHLFPLNERLITPYGFVGIAMFHFNPYTYDTTNAKYFLKPLSTEGEGIVAGQSPYSLTQISIPFGGGLKFSLTEDINIGLEVGLRKTFTDYLDDVSTHYIDRAVLLQARGPKAVELAYRGDELKDGAPYPPANTTRGNPKSKDWYYFTALSLSFRLGHPGDIFDRRNSKMRQWDCPKW